MGSCPAFRALTVGGVRRWSPQPCTKKLSIFRYPRVLILHLKRFAQNSSTSSFRLSRSSSMSKDTTYVQFEREGLDLSRYCSPYAAPSTGHAKPIYDLYGVCNHMGSLSGGHYTASVCNTAHQWHLFNDSHVSPMSGSADASSREAYVLFYRLRE